MGGRGGIPPCECPSARDRQPFEPDGVNPPGGRLQNVAAVAAAQAGRRHAGGGTRRPECPPQPGDEALQSHLDSRRRRVTPQLVDQRFDGDHLVEPEHEGGEQRPLLGAADLDDPAPLGDQFDVAEQPELDAFVPRVHRPSRPVGAQRTGARGARTAQAAAGCWFRGRTGEAEMSGTASLHQARAALSAVSARTADLVGSTADTTVVIPGSSSSVREAAVHLAVLGCRYAGMVLGEPIQYPSLPPAEYARRDQELTVDIPEARPTALSVLVREGAERLVAATAACEEDRHVRFDGGVVLQIPDLLGIAVGEHLLHGREMAVALGRPWPIDPGHTAVALVGYGARDGRLPTREAREHRPELALVLQELFWCPTYRQSRLMQEVNP